MARGSASGPDVILWGGSGACHKLTPGLHVRLLMQAAAQKLADLMARAVRAEAEAEMQRAQAIKAKGDQEAQKEAEAEVGISHTDTMACYNFEAHS